MPSTEIQADRNGQEQWHPDAQRGEAESLAREIGARSAAAETNAATAQEVSAVVTEQNAAMNSVATSSQQLAQVAERLKTSLRYFEIS